MQIQWQSTDGYVLVVDQVVFPTEDEPAAGDLEALFSRGAWIVIWRAAEDGEHDMLWHVTRNRRYEKPNLYQLRGPIDADTRWEWLIYPSGSAGRQQAESAVDPVAFAQVLYEAWQQHAAERLPHKVEVLGLDINEPAADRVPAWLRPGLRRYAERRRELRELLEELA